MKHLAPLSDQHSNTNAASLLGAVSRALSAYIAEANPYVLFNGLLADLLILTDSEYGFIGEVFHHPNGQPYLRSYATTNIAWNEETRALYAETAQKGMIFGNLNSLYGEVLKTGQPVISNHPAADLRSSGVPAGHPALNSFLGLPFHSAGSLQGMVGIANRPGGYDPWLVDDLAPFLETCSNLIRAYHNNVRCIQMEAELQSCKQHVSALAANPPTAHDAGGLPTVQLDQGYRYRPQSQSLERHGTPVRLTRKERDLFHQLATHYNQVVDRHLLEMQLWQETVVSESSLRALVLRLRKKLPGLSIGSVPGLGYRLTSAD